MKPKITLLLLLCSFMCALTNAQGKLNRAKKELSNTNSGTSERTSRNAENSFNDEVNYFDGVFVELAYYISYGVLFGDMEPRYFFKFPYAEGAHGEYAYPEDNMPVKKSQLQLSSTFFASGKEFYGNATQLNFRFLPILGIEANHTHFFEKNPSVELGITSLMLNYYRVREQFITGYWGVGITHVGNGIDATGFAYQLGLDIYLRKPYSFGISWKQSLINSASVDELKLVVRRHLKRFSLHGGFHHYILGSVTVNAAAAGLNVRF